MVLDVEYMILYVNDNVRGEYIHYVSHRYFRGYAFHLETSSVEQACQQLPHAARVSWVS